MRNIFDSFLQCQSGNFAPDRGNLCRAFVWRAVDWRGLRRRSSRNRANCRKWLTAQPLRWPRKWPCQFQNTGCPVDSRKLRRWPVFQWPAPKSLTVKAQRRRSTEPMMWNVSLSYVWQPFFAHYIDRYASCRLLCPPRRVLPGDSRASACWASTRVAANAVDSRFKIQCDCE